MALEHCATDLHQVVRSSVTPLPPAVVKLWTQQLLEGVVAVHEAGASFTFREL